MISIFLLTTLPRLRSKIAFLVNLKEGEMQEIDVRKAQNLSLKNYQHFHLSAESHSDLAEAVVRTREAKYIHYIYREKENISGTVTLS